MNLAETMGELRDCMDNEDGPAADLAKDLIDFRMLYKSGELTQEEYQFLVQEIVDVKAQQHLAEDEVACRWIVDCATLLVSAI